jgi:hypothetical protein
MGFTVKPTDAKYQNDGIQSMLKDATSPGASRESKSYLRRRSTLLASIKGSMMATLGRSQNSDATLPTNGSSGSFIDCNRAAGASPRSLERNDSWSALEWEVSEAVIDTRCQPSLAHGEGLQYWLESSESVSLSRPCLPHGEGLQSWREIYEAVKETKSRPSLAHKESLQYWQKLSKQAEVGLLSEMEVRRLLSPRTAHFESTRSLESIGEIEKNSNDSWSALEWDDAPEAVKETKSALEWDEVFAAKETKYRCLEEMKKAPRRKT